LNKKLTNLEKFAHLTKKRKRTRKRISNKKRRKKENKNKKRKQKKEKPISEPPGNCPANRKKPVWEGAKSLRYLRNNKSRY
jgi:hypothetical protein